MEEMTASKMLRDACDAPGGLDPRPEQMLAKLGWRLAGSCGHYTFSSSDAARSMCDLFGRLADKIDIELAEAKEKAAYLTDRPLSEVMAHHTGLYAKGAEPIGDWLDRWFIPRPRYEDGEPVRFGEDTDELNGIVKLIFLLGGRCCQMQDADGNIHNVFYGERVKRRPAPEKLGADGLPIDADARKNSIRYWGCEDFSCDECPALIDGKKPVAFYELDLIHDSCSEAQKLDLLRRQRELDKRTGGE